MVSSILIFVMFLLLYLLTIWMSAVGAYWIVRFSWVTYMEYSLKTFLQDIETYKIPLILKRNIFQSILIFGFWWIFQAGFCAFFVWLNLDMSFYLEDYVNPYLVFIFCPELIVSILLFAFYWYRTYSLMSKIGIYNHQIAIQNFQNFQKSFGDNLRVQEFKLLSRHDSPISFNRALQWQQRRFPKKIQKLKQKNYPDQKYQLKLLIYYLRYLKQHAYFFQNQISAYYPLTFVIDDKRTFDVEVFKRTLMNNFFAFIQM